MQLVDVYPTNSLKLQVLYDLLQERRPRECISHKKMPSPEDHVRFVDSRPYESWFILLTDGPWIPEMNEWIERSILGACYLTRANEIGISIFRRHQGNGLGADAVRLLMERHGPRRYLANINPANEHSQRMFKGLGFLGPIQFTYELDQR